MFQLQNISQQAPSTTTEVEWRSFPMPTVKKWLKRTHLAAYSLGIATVLFVNHYGKVEPPANAAPNGPVVTQPAASVSGK